MRSRPKLSTTKLALVCFSTTVLLFLGLLRFLTAPENRFYQFWQREDSVLLLLLILTIAGTAVALARWARSYAPGVAAALRVILVIVHLEALLAVVTRLPSTPPFWLVWLAPVTVFATAAIVELVWPASLYRAAVALALVLSPLGMILLPQLIAEAPVDLRVEVDTKPAAKRARTSMVIIVFDAWSFVRSTSGGRFLRSMPVLNGLADESFTFADARSPAGSTIQSFRALFAQSMRGSVVKHWRWWYGEPEAAEAEVPPRLFEAARQAGYASHIIGYYLPYRELVGESVAVIETEPHSPKGEGVLERTGKVLLTVLGFQGDPLSRFAAKQLAERVFNRYWFDLNRRVEARVSRALLQLEPGDLVLGHFPLPHSPFVFSARGRFQADSVVTRLEMSPSKYAAHLAYMDMVVGRLLESLRASGMYDATLLIVTSDHSWKADSTAQRIWGKEEERHVPLLVKWLGQRHGYASTDRFCLVGLGGLLRAVAEAEPAATPTQEGMSKLAAESCGTAATSW